MTTATIQITPRAFGNIAAAAMSHGCDVTTYLVRTAITSAPQRPAAAIGQSIPEALVHPVLPEQTASTPSMGLFADTDDAAIDIPALSPEEILPAPRPDGLQRECATR